MTYDASLVRPQLQHIPPAALALAILLHVLVGAAIWWISPLKLSEPEEDPVMVTFDSSPSNVGLQTEVKSGPPAESVAASPQPSTEPPRQEQQQALATPPRATTPPQPQQVPTLPLFEFSVPPPLAAPPPPTSRDFAKPAKPPPRPVQRVPVPPRRPAAPQRPPTDAPATMPSPSPGPYPGDVVAGQGRQRNDYLTRVFRHLEPYRVDARASRASNQRGRVVTRVTIGRDGGLIDVSIDSSSGRPALDAAELEAIRKAAPFPPVPAGMPGDPIILILRMTY